MMIFVGATYEELGLSPDQFAWGNKMKEQGILKGGEALHPQGKRISGPGRVESDGPFVESKELVGGYYTISVENVEKAMEVAQDFPDYDLGGAVEIREVVKFDRD